jgi:hypothetical protein
MYLWLLLHFKNISLSGKFSQLAGDLDIIEFSQDSHKSPWLMELTFYHSDIFNI